MRGERMQTLFGSWGAALDAHAEQVMFGRLQANPFAGGPTESREGGARLADGRLIECEPFVLPILAEQRGIPLYETESTLSKRIRTADWLNLRRRKGTHLGQLRHVRPYFSTFPEYPVMRIVHQSGGGRTYWHTMTAAGAYQLHRNTNFNFDGQTAKRSRWWAFIELGATALVSGLTHYGDGSVYGGGQVYGGVPANVGHDIVSMFRDWGSAHAELWGVVLTSVPIDITAAPTQDADGWWTLPNGVWNPRIDPATHLATRPPYMTWLYDKTLE